MASLHAHALHLLRCRGARALLAILLACLVAHAWPASLPAAHADEAHSQVAGQSEMAASRTLVLPGMEPITADMVKEGTYPIEAESSSSFFKIEHAQIEVADGRMVATIAMRTSTYPLAFLGTGHEAAAADAHDYVEFDSQDKTFTFPLEALDADIDLAAFSKNRSKWYDRKVIFYAASLPEGALLVDLPAYGQPDDEGSPAANEAGASASADNPDSAPEAVRVDLPDGEYSIEVNMTGGSGRAQVSSPTWLTISDGRAYARLLWSSPYYDYMVVDDVTYPNETTDGSNSTFTIPITVMDTEMDVVADTTAMGDPVEIDYHLTFYSDTIGGKNLVPQEAAILVLEIAAAIIVVGGILNYLLKKRKKR